jgi:hypothetical protein
MKRYLCSGLGVASAAVAGVAGAVSIVDYTSIMTGVTAELTAGVLAAAAGIGLLWGARIGTRFVRSLLH